MEAQSPLQPDSAPSLLRLQAGDISMMLDRTNGAVRYIKWGDVEVLRGVYAAVRDRHWGTVTPAISDWSIDSGNDRFGVTFVAVCRQDEIDFRWRGEITGDSAGTVSFAMDGQAHTTFDRSRIGLCVLHPVGPCVGRRCRVETVDGRSIEDVFPVHVSPHQPFFNIHLIAHEVEADVWACVAFEGEVFEMEDQRNWSDASFKTYGTPLELPYPVTIAAGTEVRQRVTLRIDSPRPPRRWSAARPAALNVVPLRLSEPVSLPRLGLQDAEHGLPLDDKQVELLRSLALDHLRVDVRLDADAWRERLHCAAREAESLRASLHVAAHFSADRADIELAAALDDVAADVSAALIFQRGADATPPELLHKVREAMTARPRQVRLVAGADSHFAELNRNRPVAGMADLLTFSVTPQVHAFDDLSIIETLEVQAEMVGLARSWAGGAEVMVSPVTLKPRDLPPVSGADGTSVPPSVDPRQASLLCAGWTLASIAELARGGAASATYYETTGWRGVMELSSAAPQQSSGLAGRGDVYPVFHVFADLAAHRGAAVRAVDSPPGDLPTDQVRGLLVDGDSPLLLLANLSDRPCAVQLPAEPTRSGATRRIRVLDQSRCPLATGAPDAFRAAPLEELKDDVIPLAPWAYVRIEA